MGILTNSEYIAQAQSRIADNAARQISEADVRITFEDTANSYINRVDGLDIPIYDNAALYGIGDNAIYNREIYQKINGSAIGAVPTNGAEWELKGSNVFAQQGRYGLARPATEALAAGGTDNFDYITPLRLREALEANGLGGFEDTAILFSNGGTASGSTNLVFTDESRVGVQFLTPNANLHVGNSSANSIIAIFANSNGENSFTFYNTGHFAVRNQTAAFPDPLVDRYKQYAKNYQSVDGQSSPYFLTEDGVEIGLRELKESVDALCAGGALSGSLESAASLTGADQQIEVFESVDNADGIASSVTATGATLKAGRYIAYYKLVTVGSGNDISVSLRLNGIVLPYATSFGSKDATGFTLAFESDGDGVLSMTATDIGDTDPSVDAAICTVQKIN